MSKFQVFDSTSVKNHKFNKSNLSKSAVIIKKEEDKIEIASDKSSRISRRNTQTVGKIKIENLSNHNST